MRRLRATDRLDEDNRFVHAAVRSLAVARRSPDPPPTRSWLERAAAHGVLPVLAAHLADLGDENLRSVQRLRMAHHLSAMADLRLVRTALDGRVDWLIFKGPVLSEVVYQRPAARDYADLDVIVARADVDAAIRLLVGRGGRVTDPDWAAAVGGGQGELTVVMPRGNSLDLHWHVLNNPTVRRAFPLRTEQLFGHARDVTIDDLPLRTFSAADTVLHVALHCLKSGGDRLRWLLDTQQALMRVDDDGALRARARELGLEMVLGLVANRVVMFVDDQDAMRIPATTRAAGIWLAADKAAMTLYPPGSGQQGRFTAAVIARSTRPAIGSSIAALLGSLPRTLWSRRT